MTRLHRVPNPYKLGIALIITMSGVLGPCNEGVAQPRSTRRERLRQCMEQCVWEQRACYHQGQIDEPGSKIWYRHQQA